MTGSTRAFFAAALLALLAAALLHLLSQVATLDYWAAATHLTLFGWITAMILGVSYHTTPVFSGRDYPYPWVAWLHWAALCVGLLLATFGLVENWPAVVVAGLVIEAAAALLFAANAVLLFRRGKPRQHRPPVPPIEGQREVDRIASYATRLSGLALPLALLLLLGVYTRELSANWHLAAEHLVTLGWLMLMIVGVAMHVLPRFSGHGTRGPAWARATLSAHLIALVAMVPALGLRWTMLFAAGAAVMALALALFAWTIWPAIVAIQPRRQPIPLHVTERPR